MSTKQNVTGVSQKDSSQRQEGVAPEEVVPPPETPDGGYGWVCTTCVALVNGHSWGINSSYAVLLAYYLEHDTFTGSSKLQYAFVGSLSIGATLAISPLATIAVRELGTRPVMLLGALLQSLSLIFASLSRELWQLLLSQGALFGVGMGLLFIPSFGIVSQWFTRRRALANGISIAGAGLGGLVYSLASGAMIKNLGLVWTFRVLSIVTFVVNVAATMFIRDRHKQTKARQLAFDLALFKRPEFNLVLLFGVFSMLGYFVLIFTLASYANEIGLGDSQASVIAALFSLGQAVGRPLIGFFSDRVGHINMAMLTTFALAVFSLAIWINTKTYGLLIFFTILQGLVAGSFWVTVGPILAQVIGLQNLPSALSILWLSLVSPSVGSSPIALQIVSSTGSYLGAQLFTGLTLLAAGFTLLILRSREVSRIQNQKSSRDEVGGGVSMNVATIVANMFKLQKV